MTLALGALAACAPPQIVVAVTTDLGTAGSIDRVEILVHGPTSSDSRTAMLTGPGATTLPATLPLRGRADEPVDVTVIGRMGDAAIVTRTVHTRFVAGHTLTLPVALLCGCGAQQCGIGATCAEATCGDGAVDPGSLGEWTGALDAASPTQCFADAGAMDARTDAPDATGIAVDAVDARTPDEDIAPVADVHDATPWMDTVETGPDAPVDPGYGILGHDTAGAHPWPLGSDRSRAIAVMPTTAVTLERIAIFVDGLDTENEAGVDASVQAVRMVVYNADGAGGDPGTVRCVSPITGVYTGRPPSWLELALTTTCRLNGGTRYYFGVHASGPAVVGHLYYDDAPTQTLWYSAPDAFADGPATFVTEERDSRLISIYALTTP